MNLIEKMCVTAIIAILATLVATSVVAAKKRAVSKARKSISVPRTMLTLSVALDPGDPGAEILLDVALKHHANPTP